MSVTARGRYERARVVERSRLAHLVAEITNLADLSRITNFPPAPPTTSSQRLLNEITKQLLFHFYLAVG